MRYLVASKAAASHLHEGCRLIADGGMISFEQPWSFGAPLIARLDGSVDLPALKARLAQHGHNGFAGEGLEEPGHGPALVIGGPILRGTERLPALCGGGAGRGAKLRRPVPGARRHGDAASWRLHPGAGGTDRVSHRRGRAEVLPFR